MGNWKIENRSTILHVNQSARVFSLDRSILWAIFFYNPFRAKICSNVLSADIICSEKRTVFRGRSSKKTASFEGTGNVQGTKCTVLKIGAFPYRSKRTTLGMDVQARRVMLCI